MINRVFFTVKADNSVDGDPTIGRRYVSKGYKEILDKASAANSTRHKGRFGYPYQLYNVLEDAYKLNTKIMVERVTDPKVPGDFVYVDVSGIRPYDIPVECFSHKLCNTEQLETLRRFNDK